MTTLIKAIIISLMALLFSCSNGSKTNCAGGMVINEDVKDGDTLSKTGNAIVIRDGKTNDTLIKYKPLAFADYSVPFEEVKFDKKLDFSGYDYKKVFKTATKKAVEDNGVNFAGHFCFADWGCGSPCKLSAVVDLKTGKVYNGISAGTGYSFKKDSRLLVVNPADSTNW